MAEAVAISFQVFETLVLMFGMHHGHFRVIDMLTTNKLESKKKKHYKHTIYAILIKDSTRLLKSCENKGYSTMYSKEMMLNSISNDR